MLWVTCRVGGDRFVIDAKRIAAILPAVSWKRVTGGPPGIVGLVNYHQTPVPLLDLSTLLFETPSQLRMHSRILLVHVSAGWTEAELPAPREHRLLGVVAEGGVEMVRRGPGDFVVPDAVTMTAPYLGPVFTDAHGVVQRIDVDALIPLLAYTQLLEPCPTAS